MTGFHLGPMTPFDIESGGLDVDNDRVVTVTAASIAGHEAGHKVTVRSGLIAVDVDIHPDATAVHGITTAHAREHGKPAADVLDMAAGELALSLTRQVPVVGMNLVFDWTILDRDCRRWGVPTVTDRLDGAPIAPVIDVYVIDRALDKYRPGKRKLTDLCAHYGVRIDGAHDSTFDALAAARVAYRMGQRAQMDAAALRALYADRRYPDRLVRAWQEFGRMTLAELHTAQIRWYREQTESFGQYLSQQAEQKRAAAGRDEAGDEERAVALQEAAELDARVDSLSPHWPLAPLLAEEATR